jgi:hypothetical protein
MLKGALEEVRRIDKNISTFLLKMNLWNVFESVNFQFHYRFVGIWSYTQLSSTNDVRSILLNKGRTVGLLILMATFDCSVMMI